MKFMAGRKLAEKKNVKNQKNERHLMRTEI